MKPGLPTAASPPRPSHHPAALWLLYALVLAIVIVDALTPAGIVVGILLVIPVLLSSTGDSPPAVVLLTATSLVGFLVAAIVGKGPIPPAAVWLPNRVFVTISIAASCPVALRLQRQRLDAQAARERAEAARDLSQLLQSLMAHDLRAPLAIAAQAVDMVERAWADAPEGTAQLLAEVEGRLQRSLSSIDAVLGAAGAALLEGPGDGTGSLLPPVDVGSQIRSVAGGFEEEARQRAKPLELELPNEGARPVPIHATVLRQVLSILLENALRYAVPGPIRIAAELDPGEVRVRVRDCGPGVSTHRARSSSDRGAGIGLKLCRVLALRAGGALTLERDEPSGSEFVLRLPVARDPARVRLLRRRTPSTTAV